VIDVKPEQGVCTVITNDLTARVYKDIPYSTGYLGPDGSGIDICPERNSQCWIVSRSSDSLSPNDGEASVIAFRTPRNSDSYLGNRIKLLPGDIRFSTAGGNELLLRKNGDIFAFSGASCSISLISSEELVKQISPSYEHEASAGNVAWTVNSSIAGGPTTCTYGIKRFASDALPYLQMTAGEVIGGGLNVSMYIDGDQGQLQFELDVSNDGVAAMFFRKSLRIETQDSIVATSKVITMSADDECTVSASKSSISLKQSMIILDADIVEIRAKQFIISNYGANMLATSVDPTDMPKKLISTDLFQHIQNHTHPVMPDEITQALVAKQSLELSVLAVEAFETKQSKLL
jgi:hypothetical protein